MHHGERNPRVSFDRKELEHALGEFSDSHDDVGAGIRHFVHTGRIRPSPIGHRPDTFRGQSRSGAQGLRSLRYYEK